MAEFSIFLGILDLVAFLIRMIELEGRMEWGEVGVCRYE